MAVLGAFGWPSFVGLFHRQVLREEAFLEQHYGKEYAEYRLRVPRYL